MKLKVTFCAYDSPDTLGGPVSWLQRLLPSLRSRGVESRCLFLTWGNANTGPTLTALRAQGFNCAAASYHNHTCDSVRWILKELCTEPPDVFVPSLMVAAYYASRWVREAGIPTVGILFAPDSFYSGLEDAFAFGAKRFRLSGIVGVSRALEARVLARNPQNLVVRRIPCGVPVFPARVVRNPSILRLAYVGRLVEEAKRISDLTHALCRAVREVPGTAAVLYGDGPDRAAVKSIIETEGGDGSVRLAGRFANSDQVQRRLIECDVLVLLSDYEGLPVALLEGMACGCVPVCLRIPGGVSELVEDEVTGLLVEDRGNSFVTAIRRLQTEPGLWQRLSRAARTKIEAGYSIERCADQWAEFLSTLHAGRGPKRPIKLPRHIKLPPPHPDLARHDPRPCRPPFPLRFYRRSRILAGRIKRQFLGLPIS